VAPSVAVNPSETKDEKSPSGFLLLLYRARAPDGYCFEFPAAGRKLEARSKKLETAPILRYLGLDVGNRRIGVAVSDELGLTAQPVLTLERRHNRREDLRSLARLCRRFAVVGIVVGNPVHLSGDVSPQAVKTQAFAAELGELTGLPIHLWDERLTTREAHQILYEAGHARQEHRKVVDQVAATLILQSFMEEQGSGVRDQRSGNGDGEAVGDSEDDKA
jgi:putative Holliday junction resolvase